jgi:hypothetical protein
MRSALTYMRVSVDGIMTDIWNAEHAGSGWQDTVHRIETKCDRNEYPPA